MRRATILLAAFAALMLVPAASAFAENQLTVEIGGSGSGELSSAEGIRAYNPNYPPGFYVGEPAIECSYSSPGPQSGTCANEMEVLEEAATALVAIPAAGSEFAGWTIDGGQNKGPTFDSCREERSEQIKSQNWRNCFAYTTTGEDITVTATFVPASPHLLNLSKTGLGTGWVHTEGPAYTINCGLPCTSKPTFFEGEATFPVIASGVEFNAWKKCPGTITGRQCMVEILGDGEEAVAEYVARHALTVTKTGSGNGYVYSSPFGINCGGPCTSKTGFFTVSSVTLTASGSEFSGWTNCPGTVEGRKCTVSLSEDKAAEVQFG